MISQKLKNAVRLSDKRSYMIAHEAGLHPSTLSRIICGIEKVTHGDQRVLSIAGVIGLPEDECFEHEKEVLK